MPTFLLKESQIMTTKKQPNRQDQTVSYST